MIPTLLSRVDRILLRESGPACQAFLPPLRSALRTTTQQARVRNRISDAKPEEKLRELLQSGYHALRLF